MNTELPRWPFPRERPLDPPDRLTALLGSCPVSKVRMYGGGQAWLVTRYDDIRTVLGSGRDYSSVETWKFQPSASRAEAERGEHSFTTMDPPEHTHYRKMLTRHFTVKRVAELQPAWRPSSPRRSTGSSRCRSRRICPPNWPTRSPVGPCAT